MRKMKLTKNNADKLKDFLYRTGKKVFDTGRKIYYADYNGKGCKISYA